MVYIEIEPKAKQFRPYLDDGVDDKRGIIDFRITIKPCNGEVDFNGLSYLVTEAIANTVVMVGKSINHSRETY